MKEDMADAIPVTAPEVVEAPAKKGAAASVSKGALAGLRPEVAAPKSNVTKLVSHDAVREDH
jgi:hypothetical protein